MAQLGTGRVELQPALPALFADHLNFACQGCGAFCCTNERLILSPLEVRLLVRATGLDVSSLSAAGWLVAYPDPQSGIPRVAVEFLPVRPGLTVCPFLTLAPGGGAPGSLTGAPTERQERWRDRQASAREVLARAREDGGRNLPLRCGVYTGRPAMCRAFPLQVKVALTPDGAATGWSALAHCRCPGHGRGVPGQTVRDYLTASDLPVLAEARLAWHDLNLAVATAGITLHDPETASRSRRALWDATCNVIFAAQDRPRLQLPDSDYVQTILKLFMCYLAPLAPALDAEERAKKGELPRPEAANLLRRLAAGCAALEAALDELPPGVPRAAATAELAS